MFYVILRAECFFVALNPFLLCISINLYEANYVSYFYALSVANKYTYIHTYIH